MFLLSYVLTTKEIALIDSLSTLLYTERFGEFESRIRNLKGSMDPFVWSALKLAYLQIYMSDNNTDYRYDEFVSLLDSLIETYDRKRNKSTREKMLLATVMAMGAVFFGKRQDIPKALALGNKSFNLYREAYREDTTVYDALLPMGLYDYAIGYLTKSSSRKKRGIEKLKVVSSKGVLAKPLAYVGLVYVYVFDNKPGKAIKYARKALSMYPNSRTFRWVLAQAYLKAGMYPEAYRTYREIKEDIKRRNPGCRVCIAEALYYMGESLHGQGKEKEARKVWYESLWYLNREKDPYRKRKVKELRKKLKGWGVK